MRPRIMYVIFPENPQQTPYLREFRITGNPNTHTRNYERAWTKRTAFHKARVMARQIHGVVEIQRSVPGKKLAKTWLVWQVN